MRTISRRKLTFPQYKMRTLFELVRDFINMKTLLNLLSSNSSTTYSSIWASTFSISANPGLLFFNAFELGCALQAVVTASMKSKDAMWGNEQNCFMDYFSQRYPGGCFSFFFDCKRM